VFCINGQGEPTFIHVTMTLGLSNLHCHFRKATDTCLISTIRATLTYLRIRLSSKIPLRQLMIESDQPISTTFFTSLYFQSVLIAGSEPTTFFTSLYFQSVLIAGSEPRQWLDVKLL
jgi:hypothetical protein